MPPIIYAKPGSYLNPFEIPYIEVTIKLLRLKKITNISKRLAVGFENNENYYGPLKRVVLS